MKVKLLKRIYGNQRTFDSSSPNIILNKEEVLPARENKFGALDVFKNGIWFGLYSEEFSKIDN